MRYYLGFLGLVLTTTSSATTDQYKAFSIGQHLFRAVAVAPEKTHLYWKDSNGDAYSYLSSLSDTLSHQGKSIRVMTNAGIYSKNHNPAGLHIEAGKRLKTLNTHKGSGNFHLQPNGVFFITKNDQANILTTQAYQKRYGKSSQQQKVRLATQSGPMLLINGNINRKFLPKSQSVHHRNGVCVTPKGKTYFFATETYPVTKVNFYTFAKAAKHLGCNNALYLDGNISKLYIRSKDSTFHFVPFVGILAVED